MLRKIEAYLREQHPASAEALTRRRLDVAIEILRQHDPKKTPTQAELTLARVVDLQLGHPSDDGWVARLSGRGHGLEHAEDILTRSRALVRNQQWKQVCTLIQSNQAVLKAYPFHAVQTGLTLADAQRRLGQVQLAGQTWQQVALQTMQLAPRWPAPQLWEQLAARRPITTPWPAEAATVLLPLLPACLHDLPRNPAFLPEAMVWFMIGDVRLQRGEASLALSAFQRANSLGAFPVWDDFLGLCQAKALFAVEQAPAATSLLTTLADRPADSPWRLPALALLGSGKLQQGHTQQAFAFLREAVENAHTDFFGRADAEANLGLAYLMRSDETNGLRWLHNAQQRFVMVRNHAGLWQCLENEAKYLEQTGNTQDANRVRQRLGEAQWR
jgi:tetratricopeptide (TPR) repeat protein